MSRIMGFARDLVLAHTFETHLTDVFFVAFKIPNFLRRLFAEGAFATAFVPVLTEYKEKRDFKALKDFVDHVSGSLGLVLIIISLIGVAAAPVVVSLFAYGWVMDEAHEKIDLATNMLRLTFPYLFFISLTAFAGGIMNAYNRFAVPAFTPVLLNLSLIGCALWLAPLMQEPIMALAWGVLLAGISQFVFQLPFLTRLRLLPTPKPKFSDEGVGRILKLMLPALFAVSVTQINLLLDTVLASFLQTGSISWLYYSDRLMEFPLGILGVALATVLLPQLSKQKAQDNPSQFNLTLDWGLRIAFLLGVPAAIGLALLAGPMIATLFMSDVFSANDVAMAQLSLMAYSGGLLAFIMIKVLAPAFYAQQDTKTPVKIGMIAMAANMALNLALIGPLQHMGLALATSLSAYLNAFLLWRGLRQSGVYHPAEAWLKFVLQVATAAFLMAVVLWFLSGPLSMWIERTLSDRIFSLLFVIIMGAVSYFLTLFLLGLRPKDFLRQLRG